MRTCALFLAVLSLCTAAGAQTVTLSGRVVLLAKGGRRPSTGADVRQAVVSFEPAQPPPVRPLAQAAKMVTRGKAFAPGVLAVPRGSRVRFPNEDPILHNVFSVSGDNQFDLGLYGRGPGKEWTFERPGVVRVFCNVHDTMVGYVVVLDTPYYTTPSARGEFTLEGLPKGPGTVTVWHQQAEAWSAKVTLPLAEPLAVGLEISLARVPAHLNKFGKVYKHDHRGQYD